MFVAYCHCLQCRQTTAAPYFHGAGFAKDAVTVSNEEGTSTTTLKAAARHTCKKCGTFMFAKGSDFTVVPCAILSSPPPAMFHIYCDEKVATLPSDGLPRFSGGPGSAPFVGPGAKALAESKLVYFGIAGRAEAARVCLALAKIPFEDKRVNFAEWGGLKPTAPFGQLPYLELKGGAVIGQSRAIIRCCAKAAGLYPDGDILAAAQIDAAMDACDDLLSTTNSVGRGADDKAAQRKAACDEGGAIHTAVKVIDQLYARVKGAEGRGPFLTGQLSVGDVMTFTNVGQVVSGFFDGVGYHPEGDGGVFLKDFPHVTAVRKAVVEHAAVAAYYEALKASEAWNPMYKNILDSASA